MDKKKRVMIIFGGESSEHEISRTSAGSLIAHIDADRYELITVGITRDGSWYLTDADISQIEDGSWEKLEGNLPLALSLDRNNIGFLCKGNETSEAIEVDVAFPILHGKNGEDGKIQAMLAMAGIPFVGSDASSSANCMDKATAKALVEQSEVARVTKCCIIHRRDCDTDLAAEGAEVFFKGEYPLFVKPSSAGSSVGISKVRTREELIKGIKTAFREDGKVLVEEAVSGRELEVAILGNSDPMISDVGEIFPAHEFYDYDAKYSDCGSTTDLAKDLPKEIRDEIKSTALMIYRIMECRGLARVDFFLSDNDEVIFNEINTMPGFTKISMYPKLWEAAGLEYPQLISRLIDLASEE